MPLLEELASILTAQGHVLGTNLFLGWLPDSPDSAAALYETAGYYPLYIANLPAPGMERPGIQVLVRDATYATGRERIESIYQRLASIGNQVVSGRWYAAVRPMQAPFALAPDERNRPRFVVNFVAHRAAN